MTDTATAAGPSAPVPAALVEITSEIVASYVTRNAVPPDDVPALIATVHATLARLGAPELKKPAPPLKPPVPVRRSVTDAHIISFEDGKPYLSLKRHLARFGLTPSEYRSKWGLDASYPMVAPAYAAKRSALAKEMGLGALRRKR